jgi:hypothetical protein
VGDASGAEVAGARVAIIGVGVEKAILTAAVGSTLLLKGGMNGVATSCGAQAAREDKNTQHET